ncbi:NADP-dependent oxidoreductase [Sphingomonas crocodyli]|uniref:NADP-dependent oxidoreductase n=1 Tax=Sphingomonas crocodyli TaxID=1979270 RepID=A0A437M0V9_9SPHN|nr:NADP-dependent oxidoreductase [Sphingomonas crocodyli]RVT91216.1 NADP-dependent oxidoreductase [Sphingomonas crocodyli]
MADAINRQWVLARRPQGAVRADDFTYIEVARPTPDLGAGEILVRTVMFSFDPAMRGWVDDVPSYLPPVAIGAPMRASAVAEIVESADPAFPVGRHVIGLLSWQDYAVVNRAGERPITMLPEGTPPAVALGVLGGSGLTAHVGLCRVGGLKPEDNVLVTGAAGAVGSVAAQIARIKGAHVVGVAGGAEKAAWLRETCGIAEVIDYRAENLDQRLGELFPKGIDLFFDNVGGDQLEVGIAHMADHGRIALCGAIATYNDAEPRPGPRNMMKVIIARLRMEGFIVMDHGAAVPGIMAELAGWVAGGQIAFRHDIQTGFANIPATLLRLFSGENRGKQLLQID